MKIIVLNGSARKGNTETAIKAFTEGAEAKNEVEIIDTAKMRISPCVGCGVCQCHKGCVANDETNMVIDKIVAADMIVFATPIYWWGMTASLKLVLDKCYCRGMQLKGKKVGMIVIGGSPVSDDGYRLIREQFQCIANYLEWNIRFHKDFSANDRTDLAQNADALAELKAEGERL